MFKQAIAIGLENAKLIKIPLARSEEKRVILRGNIQVKNFFLQN